MAKLVEYKGIRDESIHGLFVGILYQKLKNKMNDQNKKELDEFTFSFLQNLYDIEMRYTEEIYDSLNFSSDVKKFVRYNFNKALMNLGYEAHFPEEEINPIVLNGLETGNTWDFFSQKGAAYVKAKVENLKENDIDFINEMVNNSNNRI